MLEKNGQLKPLRWTPLNHLSQPHLPYVLTRSSSIEMHRNFEGNMWDFCIAIEMRTKVEVARVESKGRLRKEVK